MAYITYSISRNAPNFPLIHHQQKTWGNGVKLWQVGIQSHLHVLDVANSELEDSLHIFSFFLAFFPEHGSSMAHNLRIVPSRCFSKRAMRHSAVVLGCR